MGKSMQKSAYGARNLLLNDAADAANRPPKSLCTLTMHTGPLSVGHTQGAGLQSGSDDKIIMIWDLKPTYSGQFWGSDEVDVEGCKPFNRLPGHESDVTDLAWAPEDRFLASTGLDSQVMIWCGYTL
ncbi:HIR1_7 [Sanghuangporus sanghuang]